MLIVRAPVRLSLAGGGTDFDAYYRTYGGVVVNATIDKFVYVFVRFDAGDAIRITSSDHGTYYQDAVEGDPPQAGGVAACQAVLRFFGIDSGVSLFVASEIPPGTGLGSTSALTVAVVKGVSTARGQLLTRADIAGVAAEVEIRDLNRPVGRESQYASAFGGLNVLRFREAGVEVEPLPMSARTRQLLERNTMLFFAGAARNLTWPASHPPLASQMCDPQLVQALHGVKALALEVQDCLTRGELTRFGLLLHDAWEQRTRMAPAASNAFIDACYAAARANGAIGGSVTGGHNGGFLMLYCEEANQPAVAAALQARGLKRLEFHFEDDGARVLMNSIIDSAHPAATPTGRR